jgi:rod shape-determining protein MreD
LANVIVLLILLLLLIVQHTLIPLVSIKGISPDIILIFIIYWSGYKNRTYGVIMGFAGGLFQDLAGVGTVGVFALSKAIAAYAACSFPMSRHGKNILPWTITLFVASILHYLAYFLFQFRNADTGFLTMLLRYGLPSIFYTTVLGAMIYGIVEYVIKKPSRR